MAWAECDEEVGASEVRVDIETPVSPSRDEFSCHCCYEVLLEPCTLTCGHSFCRHCLALCWATSGSTRCPECTRNWTHPPAVNILLRDAVEKLFDADVRRRREEIRNDARISNALVAFQRHSDAQVGQMARERRGRGGGGGGGGDGGSFCSGVLFTLSCVAVVLLVYYWTSVIGDQEVLVSKPVLRWTTDDVRLWLEHLGTWTSQYRETFSKEQVNGRLLVQLSDEDLSGPPFSVESSSHRRAILVELERVRQLGVKPPQNLWEYKVVYGKKALFLLDALIYSPRLTFLYLYLFDYYHSFLPFINTCCPAPSSSPAPDTQLPGNSQPPRQEEEEEEPSWHQWVEFGVKFVLLPYQLVGDFAWAWVSVHAWTSRLVMVNALLLTLEEGGVWWRIWRDGNFRCVFLCWYVMHHLLVGMLGALMLQLIWSVMPSFLSNCLFYWALYFQPLIRLQYLLQQLRNTRT